MEVLESSGSTPARNKGMFSFENFNDVTAACSCCLWIYLTIGLLWGGVPFSGDWVLTSSGYDLGFLLSADFLALFFAW